MTTQPNDPPVGVLLTPIDHAQPNQLSWHDGRLHLKTSEGTSQFVHYEPFENVSPAGLIGCIRLDANGEVLGHVRDDGTYTPVGGVSPPASESPVTADVPPEPSEPSAVDVAHANPLPVPCRFAPGHTLTESEARQLENASLLLVALAVHAQRIGQQLGNFLNAHDVPAKSLNAALLEVGIGPKGTNAAPLVLERLAEQRPVSYRLGATTAAVAPLCQSISGR